MDNNKKKELFVKIETFQVQTKVIHKYNINLKLKLRATNMR